MPAREISLIRGALADIPAVKKAPPDVAVVSPEERRRCSPPSLCVCS